MSSDRQAITKRLDKLGWTMDWHKARGKGGGWAHHDWEYQLPLKAGPGMPEEKALEAHLTRTVKVGFNRGDQVKEFVDWLEGQVFEGQVFKVTPAEKRAKGGSLRDQLKRLEKEEKR